MRNLIDPALVHVLWGISKDFGATGLRIGCIISQGSSVFLKAGTSTGLLTYPSNLADKAVAAMLMDDEFMNNYVPVYYSRLKEHYEHAIPFLTPNCNACRKSNATLFVWENLRAVFKDKDITDDQILLAMKQQTIYITSGEEANEKPWWSLFCGLSKSSCRQPHTIEHISQIATSAPRDAVVIFGLQEVLDNQLNDIKSGLGSGWAHIGVARDDGAKSGEYCPIVYQSSVLNVIYTETKWLSPTPNVASFGWGAGSRRVVTIGVFEHKASRKRFIHANTHLDNVSSEARTKGIQVVIERIKAVQNLYGPLGVTLTGDFNSDPNGDAYKTLVGLNYMEELWNIAPHVGPNQLTYTGFTTTGRSRIDFIWLGPRASNFYQAGQIEIKTNALNDIIVSDHRAVVGDLTLL
ncbi:endonuclease/Exonuclease/phosphatase [Paramyrothecium foliicola]|nr:endonuclease/Exonuclease/phosphatase [Paramyrothecium foliicola]